MKKDIETATLAGGCFWCLEAVFDELKGVESVESGYSGGQHGSPHLSRRLHRHDRARRSRPGSASTPPCFPIAICLTCLFAIHDPTTLNRQGADVGTQYRSAIFYHDDDQKPARRGAHP